MFCARAGRGRGTEADREGCPPSSAAPPRGLTRRLSPLGEHPTGGPLRCPGSRSGACTRKELRGPSTLTSLGPRSTRAGGLGNSSLPPRGCPRRKSARGGRSSLSGWGGAGGGGRSGSAEGPGGNQQPPRLEPRSGGRRGPPFPRRPRQSSVPWSRCCLQCAQSLDIKVHAGASQSQKK